MYLFSAGWISIERHTYIIAVRKHYMFQTVIDWFKNIGRVEQLLKMQRYDQFLLTEHAINPDSLVLHGYSVYSQNDEDGILQEIFNRIGTTNKVAVEIAAGNGLESNTHLLLQCGWQCYWFEASPLLVQQIQTTFEHWLENKNLVCTQIFVQSATIAKYFTKLKIRKEIDLLSLDIDGNELSIWKALSYWKPRVVVIEYNGALGPDVELTASAGESTAWDNASMNFGASLRYICSVAQELGYELVGCNYTGVNAFFVQKKFAAKFAGHGDIKRLFQPPRLGGYIKPGFKRKSFVWQST